MNSPDIYVAQQNIKLISKLINEYFYLAQQIKDYHLPHDELLNIRRRMAIISEKTRHLDSSVDDYRKFMNKYKTMKPLKLINARDGKHLRMLGDLNKTTKK